MRDAPYSQRLCMRGCEAAVDTEHHLLFECGATAEARALHWELLALTDDDLATLMDGVYDPEQFETIMDFTYCSINAASGPAA